jgi:aryl-alcohol dehydrogenase-like predicted oxidoreductase
MKLNGYFTGSSSESPTRFNDYTVKPGHTFLRGIKGPQTLSGNRRAFCQNSTILTQGQLMSTVAITAAASGTFTLGGDLTVHRLGFGAMRITGPGIWGEPKDRDEAIRVLKKAVELDVNFIDTADSYGPEVSERLIREALYPYPKGLVIATKAGLTRQGPDQWAPVGRPEYLRQQLELSLRRLHLERIDLFQLHRIDPRVPLEETMGALGDLQKEGKVRHIGLSEVNPEEIEKASRIVTIVSVQNRYNFSDREHEPALEYCEPHGLGFIPWFPVAAGKLARPGGPLDALSRKHGATVAQLSLAWLLHRSPVMLPIPGTSSVKHLEENIAASGLKISADEWAVLEKTAAGD